MKAVTLASALALALAGGGSFASIAENSADTASGARASELTALHPLD